MRVRPVNGATIRMPENGQHLPERGKNTQAKYDHFWNRRLADGSVELVPDKKKPGPKPKVETTEDKESSK